MLLYNTQMKEEALKTEQRMITDAGTRFKPGPTSHHSLNRLAHVCLELLTGSVHVANHEVELNAAELQHAVTH